jgi:hypothetical protein
MYNKSACYNSRPLTGRNGPSQMGVALHAKKIDLSIGAGVYHPQLNEITTVNPGWTSINDCRQSEASRICCRFDK